MKEKGKELWNRYGAVLLYLFFGGCTTILNVCLYYCLRHLAGYSLNASNIAAWVGAVLFAYVTNRKWVFESKAKGALPVAKEIGRFLPAACHRNYGCGNYVFYGNTLRLERCSHEVDFQLHRNCCKLCGE